MKVRAIIIMASVALAGCQTNNVKTTLSKPGINKTKQSKTKVARNSVQSKIKASARKHGVPVTLALAVSHQESGHRCHVRGAAGEMGPLQIKPASARGFGYRGSTKQLSKNCSDQIEFGMRHLAAAYKRGHSCWKAAYLHNAGVYAKSYKISGARHYANVVTRKANCS